MTDSKAPTLDSQPYDEAAQPEQMADTYADRLMDELFDGIERALEGDVEALDAKPQPEVAEPPEVSELTLNFSEGGLPAVLLDRGTTTLNSPETTDLAAIADEAAPTAPPSESPEKAKPIFGALNKVLLGIAGLTALAACGLWLQQRQQAVPVTATSPATAEAPAIDADVEFLEYLRRSLDVIAQNAPAATSDATASVNEVAISLNNGGVGLPPIGNNVIPGQMPGGVPTAPGSINVIERVYVPYPSTQAAANPSSVPANTAVSGSTTTGNATTSAAPAVVHTLVGVLELGERSAALFEVDGTTQRVYIGERIGSSGWSLVSVANEEAVVRRNGEVRTLYIGQRF